MMPQLVCALCSQGFAWVLGKRQRTTIRNVKEERGRALHLIARLRSSFLLHGTDGDVVVMSRRDGRPATIKDKREREGC
jgi:hypothetical protein